MVEMATVIAPGSVDIVPGITFTPFNATKDLNLVNYSDQISTLTKMAKKAFDGSSFALCLMFGMAGTGKTSLVKQSAWLLCNSHGVQCSHLEIKCNTLVRASSTADVAKYYLDKSIIYVEKYRPMIVVFDELDALARNRVLADPRITEFSLLMCGLLDDGFRKTIKENGRLMIVGITNDPEGVDDAVRDRLGPTIYVPLPTLSVIREILQKEGMPQYARVADKIGEYLGNDSMSPRGLVEACRNMKNHMSKMLEDTSVSPEEIAREILGSGGGRKSQHQVEEYERRNDAWKKTSEHVLDHWRKL